MEYLKRIISIRKHKTIVFADVLDENFNLAQLKMNYQIFDKYNLNVGDVIYFVAETSINKRNQTVYEVIDIKNVTKPTNYSNYKQMISENDIYKQALNGKINLKHWEFKNRLLEEINNYLLAKKFIRVITSNFMKQRGTSIVNPIKVSGKYIDDKYFKITHELELKKQVYLTLRSLYEIGYVARDIYSTKKSFFEYLNLEMVSINVDTNILISFYEFINKISIKIANELGIEYNEFFNELNIIDVINEYQKKYAIFNIEKYNSFYQSLKENNPNCIFVNVITDNPLVKKSFGEVSTEIKWIIDNNSVGHGYIDENNIDIILSSFNKQKENLKREGILAEIQDDYIQVLMDAGIDTISLNLGIDRFIRVFLNYNNIKKTYKILGV